MDPLVYPGASSKALALLVKRLLDWPALSRVLRGDRPMMGREMLLEALARELQWPAGSSVLLPGTLGGPKGARTLQRAHLEIRVARRADRQAVPPRQWEGVVARAASIDGLVGGSASVAGSVVGSLGSRVSEAGSSVGGVVGGMDGVSGGDVTAADSFSDVASVGDVPVGVVGIVIAGVGSTDGVSAGDSPGV